MIHNRNKIIFFITLLSGFFVPSNISSMHRILRLCSDDTIVDGVFVPGARGVTTINVTNNHHAPATGDEAPRARARSSAKVVPLNLAGVDAEPLSDEYTPKRKYKEQVRLQALNMRALHSATTSHPSGAGAGHAGGAYGSPRGRTTERSPKAPRGTPRHRISSSPIIHSPKTTGVRQSLRARHQDLRFEDTVTELDGDFASPTTAAARAARERRHRMADAMAERDRRHTTGGRPPYAAHTMVRSGSLLKITDLEAARSPQGPPNMVFSPKSRHSGYLKSDRELHTENREAIFARMEETTELIREIRAIKNTLSLKELIHKQLVLAEVRKYSIAESASETPEDRELAFLNNALYLITESRALEAKTSLISSYSRELNRLSEEYSKANRKAAFGY